MKQLISSSFATLLLFLMPFHSMASRIESSDSSYVFTDLRLALKNPEAVYNLDLNCQKLSALELTKLSAFKNLVRLDLSCVWMHAIPNSVFKCRKLRYLNLENNRITKIPSEIGVLSLLEELIIGYNELETLPPELFTLTHLRTLDLSGISSLESLPRELQSLKKLEHLDCHTSSEEFSQVIAPMTSLKKVSIVSEDFISPCHLLKLEQLEVFKLTLLHPARFTVDQFDCSLTSSKHLLEYHLSYYDFCCPWLNLQDEEIETIKSLLPPSCAFSGYLKKEEIRSDIELR